MHHNSATTSPVTVSYPSKERLDTIDIQMKQHETSPLSHMHSSHDECNLKKLPPTFCLTRKQLPSSEREELITRAGRRLLRGRLYCMPPAPEDLRGVTQINHSQINLHKRLGQGTYSDVYCLSSLDIPEAGTASKLCHSASQVSELPSADRLVVKTLKKELLSNLSMFAACAADIVKEGLLLSNLLPHPNLVKLHGITSNGIHAFMDGHHDAFFLVLEKLDITLDQKLTQWRKLERNGRRSISNPFPKRTPRTERCSRLQARLQVISDLGNVVTHLHSQSVIHRDLKPENIGFDQQGVLKLFDFDVARILPWAGGSRSEDETFKMTKCTGTRCYMSPECGSGARYNAKSDVYSYTMLAFEVLSLIEPLRQVPPERYHSLVFEQGLRPLMPRNWPSEVHDFFRRGWNQSPVERPTMEQGKNEWNSLVPKIIAEDKQLHSK